MKEGRKSLRHHELVSSVTRGSSLLSVNFDTNFVTAHHAVLFVRGADIILQLMLQCGLRY